MATHAPEAAAHNAVAEESAPSRFKRFNFKSKQVRVVALLVGIMVIEACAMYLVQPPPAATNAVEEVHNRYLRETVPVQTSLEGTEVLIDRFNTSNTTASPNKVIHTTFELSVIVAVGNGQKFERAANKDHHARVRQAVEKVMRSAKHEHLNDPYLIAIKQRIREEVNNVLKTSYIIDVVINGFQMTEE